MQLAHPFSVDTRALFLGVWACFLCGANGQNRGGLELHHIWGRVSASPLNAALLCGECHRHCGHSLAERATLHCANLNFLARIGYAPVPSDDYFLGEISGDVAAMRRLGLASCYNSGVPA